MENKTLPVATVGMLATITIGSDRYAAKVIAVSPSGKTLTVQETDRPSGEIRTYRWSTAQGRFRSEKSFGLRLGTAETYMDPCF